MCFLSVWRRYQAAGVLSYVIPHVPLEIVCVLYLWVRAFDRQSSGVPPSSSLSCCFVRLSIMYWSKQRVRIVNNKPQWYAARLRVHHLAEKWGWGYSILLSVQGNVCRKRWPPNCSISTVTYLHYNSNIHIFSNTIIMQCTAHNNWKFLNCAELSDWFIISDGQKMQ